jgi:pimeloyl-ACP methyl ester carboxylesterase
LLCVTTRETDHTKIDHIMAPVPVARLAHPSGYHIAYRCLPASGFGTRLPGVVFLAGFKSDMSGSKVTALEEFCRVRGQAFLCFDYFGHGQTGGAFVDGTIGRWRDDALAVLDHLTSGPQIVIGSSMGGWLMLLTALARRSRIHGLIGIAAAPDFTEDLIWSELNAADQAKLQAEGTLSRPSAYAEDPYVITWKLITEARQHLLLRAPVELDCPIRLLHGMEDPDVPVAVAMRLAERLTARDLILHLIKDGDHRLSRPQDLALLFQEVAALSGG